jgi:hypothetical protein
MTAPDVGGIARDLQPGLLPPPGLWLLVMIGVAGRRAARIHDKNALFS